MDEKFICYCGLYCKNCAVKVKVEPAAVALHNEMKKAGFEEILPMMPEGEKFWTFLKGMVNGVCVSCKEGSGNPGCAVRKCAQEKNISACALCEEYPCAMFEKYYEGYPVLKQDNALLRNEGMEAWAKVQDDRQAKGFTYNN